MIEKHKGSATLHVCHNHPHHSLLSLFLSSVTSHVRLLAVQKFGVVVFDRTLNSPSLCSELVSADCHLSRATSPGTQRVVYCRRRANLPLGLLVGDTSHSMTALIQTCRCLSRGPPRCASHLPCIWDGAGFTPGVRFLVVVHHSVARS